MESRYFPMLNQRDRRSSIVIDKIETNAQCQRPRDFIASQVRSQL